VPSPSGRLRVGTSSWTDKTLLESGWYPADANNPEERLKHYASNFDVVEVDSTYYGLPSERNAGLWVERTPKDFRFEVKAFSLMTGHPTAARSLPKDIREAVPEGKSRVYPKDLPSDAIDAVWEAFRRALMPLHSAGKLGMVMFQFPQWFVPGRPSRGEVLAARDRLPDYDVAVEFRNGSWFDDERSAKRTLEFLREEGIPLVCVDMPQGFRSSVPPIAEATSDRFAVVRFHGRRSETWEKKGIPVVERFRYDYSDDELKEWVPKVRQLEGEGRETHALFNNCYRDYGVRNARTFGDLVEQES
jgi:uncharacterized protein YecE (DUF72 family)